MFKKQRSAEMAESQGQIEQQQKVYEFTLGNIENSVATLFDQDFNSMHVYDYLLPKDIEPGSVITVSFKRNRKLEEQKKNILDKIQKRIMKEDELLKSTSILKEETNYYKK